ncbi:MAG: amino acid ABC transporter substrate-binding protein [Chloroflexota bacterium]
MDICRAIAAAVLGDPDAVTWVPLEAEARAGALADGSIDVLSRNSTWTFSREATWGVFGPVVFLDGTDLLAPAAGPVAAFPDLEGRTLCVVADTTTEDVVLRHADDTAVDVAIAAYPSIDAEVAAYLAGDCDAIASDRSQLAGIRSELPDPAAHAVLGEDLSDEPLAPVVPHGDADWASVVRWVVFALIRADELGLGTATLAGAAMSTDGEVRRLAGAEPGPAAELGLADGWTAVMLAAVGSYGDIWERNLGTGTPLGLTRGRNAAARDGGLLWAPPYR